MGELVEEEHCGHYSETYLVGKGYKELKTSIENWQSSFLGLEAEEYEET